MTFEIVTLFYQIASCSWFFTVLSYAQGIELNGTISAEENQIKNVADPTEAQDAVTLSVLLEKIIALQDQIDNAGIGSIDQEANTYDYLTYGDQVWTVENPEMVTYRDGTPIPKVTDPTQWLNLTTGAWSYYENNPEKPRFYNWYTVMGIHDEASLSDASLRKEFAPQGWHVPSDAEWITPENYLTANGYNNDDTIEGNTIAKAMASTTGWDSSTETGATGNDQSLNNDSGFKAFPEGFRSSNGSFNGEGYSAIFWSSLDADTNYVWNRYVYFNYSNLNRIDGGKRNGYSVRFVRD